MQMFVYSYEEREWLKNSLAVTVKTYLSKAEIQLFLNSYSFYFYTARNTKDLMQSTERIVFSHVILKAQLHFAFMQP